jgi:putative transposase
MSRYRRIHQPGGMFFFTVALADRRETLLTDNIELLRAAFRDTNALYPFRIDAIVVLPEHLHCIWSLPSGDSDFALRWRLIKGRFSKALMPGEDLSPSRASRSERGIWQRRFWEHAIRDELDYRIHLDYIHMNPVKHGHGAQAVDWPHSSFHRYVRQGVYPRDWGVAKVTDGSFGERVTISNDRS